MEQQHPSDDDLERFLVARLSPAEQQRVVRHLLAGCAACSRKLVGQAPERLLEIAAESGRRSSKTRDPLRDHTLAEVLKQDTRWRVDDKKLKRSLQLLRQSTEEHIPFQQGQALQGLPLVKALLQRVSENRFLDPKTLRWFAYEVVKAAESLRGEGHDSCQAPTLQAQAWAELANAYRINEEFDEAAAAFSKARTLLRENNSNLELQAQTANFESSLLRAQRRMAEAAELIDAVHRAYVELGDSHRQGRTLISKAVNLRYRGHFQQAIAFFQKGLPLIDEDREPHLIPVLQQSFVTALIDSGDYQEAGRLLLKSGLRKSLSGFPLALIKLRWAEGQLLVHLENYSSAERVFAETRGEFMERQLDYDAALAGLDLLSLWNHQGKSTKVRKLAREVYGVLRDLGIRTEAAKAERYLH